MGRGELGRSETVGLSSKFWEAKRKHVNLMLYDAGFGFGRDRGSFYMHTVRRTGRYAPPLQEFGGMLKRRIRNRIQSRDGKRICGCWRIVSVACTCARVYVYLRVSDGMNEWVTCTVQVPTCVIQPLNSALMQSLQR